MKGCETDRKEYGMFAFLGCIRMRRIQVGQTAMVGMAIVSTLFVLMSTAGCKKKAVPKSVEAKPIKLENVYTNRMNDAVYVETLRKNREEQSAEARERAVLGRQIQACRERVKAVLPEGSDEAALKAALARDPEWQKLDAAKAQLDGRIQATLNAAEDAVRKRIESEARAVKAVAEGKAVPIDRAEVKK